MQENTQTNWSQKKFCQNISYTKQYNLFFVATFHSSLSYKVLGGYKQGKNVKGGS